MDEPASLPTVPVTVRTIDPDTVMAALGEPSRRRLLVAMFDGQPRTGTVLARGLGKRLSATLKHLGALREAGLIVTEQDKVDGRRQAYLLAPSVKVATTPEGRTMDFGYCLLRV
jgi:DNA-binding transcriptional ArsR family regulator